MYRHAQVYYGGENGNDVVEKLLLGPWGRRPDTEGVPAYVPPPWTYDRGSGRKPEQPDRRPFLRIPLDAPEAPDTRHPTNDPPERGVAIIDFTLRQSNGKTRGIDYLV